MSACRKNKRRSLREFRLEKINAINNSRIGEGVYWAQCAKSVFSMDEKMESMTSNLSSERAEGRECVKIRRGINNSCSPSLLCRPCHWKFRNGKMQPPFCQFPFPPSSGRSTIKLIIISSLKNPKVSKLIIKSL